MIFVIDDDEIMAECVGRAVGVENRIFADAFSAMAAISDGEMPGMIFLDILLDGPNGFTFLNELVSYNDTARIPVVIMSSLDFKDIDLSGYNKTTGTINKTDNDMLRWYDKWINKKHNGKPTKK